MINKQLFFFLFGLSMFPEFQTSFLNSLKLLFCHISQSNLPETQIFKEQQQFLVMLTPVQVS